MTTASTQQRKKASAALPGTEARRHILSLFCGSGGLDHGFERSGFEPVLALDNSADAVLTYNQNSPFKVGKVLDIAKLTPAEFLALVPVDAHPIGLIGGPPCQGFSQGNVFSTTTDPRNSLPFRYAELLKAANQKYKLKFFVFENVIGLARPKHAIRFKSILSRLRKAGFNVFPCELNASDFEVPQRRRRLFIVGLNSELYPDAKFQLETKTTIPRTVKDAIHGLPEPSYFSRLLVPEMIPFHPNHWTMVPKSAKFRSGNNSSGRSFKRLEWDAVSPTVAYGHREIHVHPSGKRRLSVFEAMLLQGFPKEFKISGNLSSQITQISNAVPPPVAEAVAEALKKQLLL